VDILEHVFTTNPDADHSFAVSTEQVANVFLKQPQADRVRATNLSEIAWIVRHLKPRKAAGPDGIQNIILQHLPRLVLKFIAKIFNSSLSLNNFLTLWKVDKMIMLPKPGKDHSSPLNYRPISLLNSLAKLFEKMILKRLNFQLREMSVIRYDQYGFTSGHSTTHALLRNVERITHGFNNNKATATLFLNTEWVFDKVWFTGLIAKLIKEFACSMPDFWLEVSLYPEDPVTGQLDQVFPWFSLVSEQRLTDGGEAVTFKYRPRSTIQKHFPSASGNHFCYRLSKAQGLVRLEALGKLIQFSYVIGSRTRDLPLVAQFSTTTLTRAPEFRTI
jgi:hypothetical protein